MQIERIIKSAFTVIGLEGSTAEGADFITRLWAEANARFGEVAPLARTGADGTLLGIWGAMSDMARTFAPWEEDFTTGLYLAGVECAEDTVPPPGWTKWRIPGYEYLRAPAEEGIFPQMLQYIRENGLHLVGAVHDFTNPATGRGYMLFPIRRL